MDTTNRRSTPARHREPSAYAGKVVRIKASAPQLGGSEYRVEDWWDRLGYGSWMHQNGNPACLNYAIRSGLAGLPTDDEVLYGKIGAFGHLVHVSEIEES